METVATQHADYNLDAMRGSAYKASSLLKAMGNADRLMLLCQLSQGEHCVSDLEQKVGIGQQTLSQQLGVLRREGAVDTRREGKFIWYRLADGRVLQLMQAMYQLFCAPAHAAPPEVERSEA